MATDPKVIAVAFALKQSLEQNAGAGSSINAHPNAFFLNVNGAVDLYKMAESALKRAESYEENLRASFEDEVKRVANKLRAEFQAGAVSIADAWARLKAKAGGEFISVSGAAETAEARVSQEIASVSAALAAVTISKDA